MKNIFLFTLLNSNAKSKGKYIKDFFYNCYINREFILSKLDPRIKIQAYDVFCGVCYYIFDQYLKKLSEEIGIYECYMDENNNQIDFDSCEIAKIQAAEKIHMRGYDYRNQKRVEEYYDTINDILVKKGLKEIKYKMVVYTVDENNINPIDCQAYVTDMTRLFEIIKYSVIKKMKSYTEYKRVRASCFGVTHKKYRVFSEEDLEKATEFIMSSVCYYDRKNDKKYYSVEDIETENEKNVV